MRKGKTQDKKKLKRFFQEGKLADAAQGNVNSENTGKIQGENLNTERYFFK